MGKKQSKRDTEVEESLVETVLARIQGESKFKKKGKGEWGRGSRKHEKHIRNDKTFYIHITGISEGQARENKAKALFKERVLRIFQNKK